MVPSRAIGCDGGEHNNAGAPGTEFNGPRQFFVGATNEAPVT